MQTLSNRTRPVLLALAVVLSAVAVAPLAGSAPTAGYTQQDNGESSEGSEPDGGIENATDVDSLDGIEGAIGPEGTPDVYAVELEEGSGIELTEGTVGGGPIELLDRDGTVLDRIPAGTNFTGEEYTLRAQAEYTGTYYLRVGGAAGDRYEIGAGVTAPDANEPDDIPEAASAIALGEHVRGTAIKGDPDFYALELEDGAEFAIAANGTAAAEVRLVDPDGEPVATSEIHYPDGYVEGELGQRNVIETTAEQDGTYSIAVAIPENHTGNVDGDYNLTVLDTAANDTAPSDDSAASNESESEGEDSTDAEQQSGDEPNDGIETATRANEEEAIDGEIDGADDVDYYALDATAGSQFEISQGIASSAITLTLLDAEGNTIATRPSQSTYEAGEELLIANASDGGTYYLRVEGEAGDRYSIGAEITEPDAYEPNDAIDSPTTIDAGEEIAGTILRGDSDYFAIEAAAGERLVVNATGVESSRATLYGPDDEAIESGPLHAESSQAILENPDARTVLSTTVEESGTYYVGIEQASSYTGEINGAYDLTVQTRTDDADGADATTTEATTEGTEDDAATTGEASNEAGESTTSATTATASTADATTTADDSGSTDSPDTASPDTAGSSNDAPASSEADSSADSSEIGTAGSGTTDSDTPESAAAGSTGDAEAGRTTSATSETTTSESTTSASSAGSETTDTQAGGSTPTATDSDTGVDAETTNGTHGNDGSVVEDAEETAVNGPGFGIVAALLALLGAAVLATRRN